MNPEASGLSSPCLSATAASDNLRQSSAATDSNQDDVLARSVCVRNVEYSSTVEELKEHFKDCCGDRGTNGILRVTIAKNKFNGHPLGYAYIEFDSPEAAKKSKALDESLFKGRQLTVLDKRKNIPKLGNKAKRGGIGLRGRGKPNFMMGGRGGL